MCIRDSHQATLDDFTGAWSAPFVMAPINTKNVHRSNALLGHLYGRDFVYDERMSCGAGPVSYTHLSAAPAASAWARCACRWACSA